MSYEFTIAQIDNERQKISDFDNDTLFENIYNYWCFTITCQCTIYGAIQRLIA